MFPDYRTHPQPLPPLKPLTRQADAVVTPNWIKKFFEVDQASAGALKNARLHPAPGLRPE